MRIGLLCAAAGIMAWAGTARAVTYFEVGELPGHVLHHDSYVLPLTNASDIQHARDLITKGPGVAGATIVFANIAAGADGINRNWQDPNKPQWAWHVTGFTGFGDFGIEVLDGWPTYVNQNLSTWLPQTNSRIGFWNYTVVRELPVPEPGTMGILALGVGMIAVRVRSAKR